MCEGVREGVSEGRSVRKGGSECVSKGGTECVNEVRSE